MVKMRIMPYILFIAGSGLIGTIFAGRAQCGDHEIAKYSSISKMRKSVSEKDVLEAIIQRESGGNPNAQRYEPHLDKDPATHLDDTSYGLAQFIPRTAQALEKIHPDLPRLGNTEQEIINSLCNPEISRAYLGVSLRDNLQRYKNNMELAIAAHNAGNYAPRNAAIQHMLNSILKEKLAEDGCIGPRTREKVKLSQQKYGCKVDGKIGPETLGKLAQAWKQHTGKNALVGKIPENGHTPGYVRSIMQQLQ